MAALPGVHEISANLTDEQRIELLLDLARRAELLDTLLRTVRARRRATHAEFCVTELDQAEIDAMIGF
jgi:hypothetical protein